MKIALAQINPTVGDIAGNTKLILDRIKFASDAGAELIVFPELAVFGYPPKDLVCRQSLVRRNAAAVVQIAQHCHQLAAVVGYVRMDPASSGKGIFNSAALLRNGRIETVYDKMLLPTYDVFDESRYFTPGRKTCVFPVPFGSQNIPLGLTICEDLWNNRQFEGRGIYGSDPIAQSVQAGAKLLINLSASPFRVGIHQQRETLFGEQAREHHVPLVYVNQVGGNDDLIFDGASLVMDAQGRVTARARAFAEDLLLVSTGGDPAPARIEPYPDDLNSMYEALVLGLRDYVHKCGFKEVVLGLSGGIDSCLTAVLAVEALGANCVHGVALPSRFNSNESLEDARQLASNLGISLQVISIEDTRLSVEHALSESFAGKDRDVAEENLQARIRGNILMALSNKFGRLLLTTGNKSELAVGFCTLYGDMCGGLAVISDVPKTTVYALSRRINERAAGPRIPQRCLDKAPSAELRENQTDQDTIPPYDLLDRILEQYVERDLCIDEIGQMGLPRDLVEQVACMVDRSEFKRKQAAVGLKVTSRAFGTGRRMPIAAKYS